MDEKSYIKESKLFKKENNIWEYRK